MKKNLFLIVFIFFTITAFSQGNSGLGFNYQAVIRGADGFILSKQNVELRFSLMPGQQATVASWVEIHKVTTDAYGTIGVTVGKGIKENGVAAAFKDVNFAAVHYWMKVEIVEGTSYRDLSYAALSSVPYAEAATNAVSSPVGSVMPFAGDASKVPPGWLLCDGSAISRSEYATLYDIIGTAYGFGNNSTTFNLPDMRGMFLRGVSEDSGKDEDAATRVPLKEGGNSGNKVGSYQGDEFRSHKHTNNVWSGFTGGQNACGTYPGGYLSASGNRGMRNGTADCVNSNEINANGGRETRPKNVYVNYIIKF